MEQGFEIASKVYNKIKEKKSLLLPIEMYLSLLEFFNKIKEFKLLEWNRTVHEKESVIIDCNSVEHLSLIRILIFLLIV